MNTRKVLLRAAQSTVLAGGIIVIGAIQASADDDVALGLNLPLEVSILSDEAVAEVSTLPEVSAQNVEIALPTEIVVLPLNPEEPAASVETSPDVAVSNVQVGAPTEVLVLDPNASEAVSVDTLPEVSAGEVQVTAPVSAQVLDQNPQPAVTLNAEPEVNVGALNTNVPLVVEVLDPGEPAVLTLEGDADINLGSQELSVPVDVSVLGEGDRSSLADLDVDSALTPSDSSVTFNLDVLSSAQGTSGGSSVIDVDVNVQAGAEEYPRVALPLEVDALTQGGPLAEITLNPVLNATDDLTLGVPATIVVGGEDALVDVATEPALNGSSFDVALPLEVEVLGTDAVLSVNTTPALNLGEVEVVVPVDVVIGSPSDSTAPATPGVTDPTAPGSPTTPVTPATPSAPGGSNGGSSGTDISASLGSVNPMRTIAASGGMQAAAEPNAANVNAPAALASTGSAFTGFLLLALLLLGLGVSLSILRKQTN